MVLSYPGPTPNPLLRYASKRRYRTGAGKKRALRKLS